MRSGPTGLAVLVLFAVVPGSLACTPRPRLDPRPGLAAAADLCKADALVREGCYACLQDALAIYERLAAEGRAPAAAERAADTALLLAVRERELGLGQGTARARADALVRALPPPADYALYQSVVDVIPWHQSGVSRERQDTQFGAFRTVSANWTAWRTALATRASREPLSAYAFLALECHFGYILKDRQLEAWTPGDEAPPLLRFQQAVCERPWDAPALETLLRDVPRFGEANLFLGETAYGRGTLHTAEKYLLKAADTIPGWPAAHLALGDVYFLMEDLESAAASYHRVSAAVPGQRDAMLGEVKSLSYLGRSGEAIAILDEMERLGTWYMGEMHYWRAWNRHRLKDHAAADADVVSARKYLPMDPFVDKLTGLVALALTDVPRAEAEFRLAVQHFAGRNARDCDSSYYLASTLVMQKKWAEAAPVFEKAEPCYGLDEEALAAKVRQIKASELPEERKARLVAAKERDIAAVRLQQGRACFNAAVAYANLGNAAKARPFAERAAAVPDLAQQARVLLDLLGKQAPEPLP